MVLQTRDNDSVQHVVAQKQLKGWEEHGRTMCSNKVLNGLLRVCRHLSENVDCFFAQGGWEVH